LAFTLVELLVVITIIGILAALITAAGAGALKRARQAQIKVEVDQISMALQTYKDTAGSYPPNALTDFGSEETVTVAMKAQILTDLKRHLKQAFPRHREPDSLLQLLVGQTVAGSGNRELPGGMTAGEAVVFWMGGFSSDPKYPISGERGPSYALPTPSGNPLEDPITDRKWVYPCEVARLGPRSTDSYFDDSTGRYLTYNVAINGVTQNRRINFWQYLPAKSEQPYVYFDTSRHTPDVLDPPASPEVHVHALKKIENPGWTSERVLYVNPDKFQLLHCGIDEEWGADLFDHTSYSQYVDDKNEFLSYPDGPFTGEVADTIVNFSEGTLEASQP
jgi:prepilin-type N-terminal cleavage/methylation domain-containing protein